MKIAVLSDGGWGTALALLLLGNRHEVCLWGPFPDYIAEMARTRRNERFLKGVELPAALHLTADMAAAVRAAGIVVMASPTQYARQTIGRLPAAGFDARRQLLVNVAKGIEVGTLKRLSEIAAELLGEVWYVGLPGPSHAEEVARGFPTVVTAASAWAECARQVQAVFMNERFRVYTSDDTVGIELGGALKNVYALAGGICDGMKLGDNAKAALLTRGIAEMARLGQALGGHPETFAGLSGIGDLIVTCYSGHSRNRHVGEELGRGLALDEITQAMGMVVAEGVKTTLSAHALAHQRGVYVPIVDEIHAVLYQGKPPRQALRDLMTRDPRAERD